MCDHRISGCRQREKKRKRASSLNQDMIVSILTKLPSKSLVRFRSACKSWDSLISGRYFINSHLQQQQKMPRILMLQRVRVPKTLDSACKRRTKKIPLNYSWLQFSMIENGPPTTINFLFKKELLNGVLGRAHHCNGLLLYHIMGLFFQRHFIYVCNLSTRELLSLPTSLNYDVCINGRDISYRDSLGFGFDRSINKYKIVRNFYEYATVNPNTYKLGMEVFTLGGASNTWKLLKNPPYPVCHKRSTSAHGAIYWKVWNDVHTLPPKAILRFDLSDEEFRLIDPPPPFRSDLPRFWTWATLMDIQDNLFCAHACRSHEFFLWMLNREEKWTLSYRFKLPPGICHFDNIAIHRGKLFLTLSNDLYVLNPETSSLLKIMSDIGQILTFPQNLTPIGGI